MAIRLKWRSVGNEDGQRVYRSDTQFTKDNLPSIYASLSAGVEEYEDSLVSSGNTYWYAVSAYAGSPEIEKVSDPISILATSGAVVAEIFAVTFTQEDVAEITTGTTISISFGAAKTVYEKGILTASGFFANANPVLSVAAATSGTYFPAQMYYTRNGTSDYNVGWGVWVKPTGADLSFTSSQSLGRIFCASFLRASGAYDIRDIVTQESSNNTDASITVTYADKSFSWYSGGNADAGSPVGISGAGTIVQDVVRVDADSFWVEVGYDTDANGGSRVIGIDDTGSHVREHLTTNTIAPGGSPGDGFSITFIDSASNVDANVDPGLTISPTPQASDDYIVIFYGQTGSNEMTSFDGQAPTLLASINDGFEFIRFYHVTGVTSASPVMVLNGSAAYRSAASIYKLANWDPVKFIANGANSEASFTLWGQAGGGMIGAALSQGSGSGLGISNLTNDHTPLVMESNFIAFTASANITVDGDVSLQQDANGTNTGRATCLVVSFGGWDED